MDQSQSQPQAQAQAQIRTPIPARNVIPTNRALWPPPSWFDHETHAKCLLEIILLRNVQRESHDILIKSKSALEFRSKPSNKQQFGPGVQATLRKKIMHHEALIESIKAQVATRWNFLAGIDKPPLVHDVLFPGGVPPGGTGAGDSKAEGKSETVGWAADTISEMRVAIEKLAQAKEKAKAKAQAQAQVEAEAEAKAGAAVQERADNSSSSSSSSGRYVEGPPAKKTRTGSNTMPLGKASRYPHPLAPSTSSARGTLDDSQGPSTSSLSRKTLEASRLPPAPPPPPPPRTLSDIASEIDLIDADIDHIHSVVLDQVGASVHAKFKERLEQTRATLRSERETRKSTALSLEQDVTNRLEKLRMESREELAILEERVNKQRIKNDQFEKENQEISRMLSLAEQKSQALSDMLGTIKPSPLESDSSAVPATTPAPTPLFEAHEDFTRLFAPLREELLAETRLLIGDLLEDMWREMEQVVTDRTEELWVNFQTALQPTVDRVDRIGQLLR